MKKIILALSTFAIFAGPALGITYRRPVTSHSQLTSTGTLTHAALESTLTAVNAATTTLKSVSDAHAATLAQVGVDTATLAGLVGSGAGDNLGNHVATTTLNMGFNNISNPSVITSTADITIQTQFNYAYPFGGIKLRGNSYGISMRGIDIDNEGIVTMGPTVFGNTVDFNYRITFSSLGFISDRLPFRMNQGDADTILLVRDGGYGIFTGSVTASAFYGDHYGDGSNLTGITAAASYFTVSPSTGIDNGTLADGVKVTTGNVTASGTPDATTFWRGDGSWATPSGSGDMVQATHGVAIAESTTTLRADVTALQQSTGTLQADLATEVSDRGLADTAIGVTTGTLGAMLTTVGASTATLRADITAVGASTSSIKSILTQVQTDTGTIKMQVTAIGTSTGTIATQITAIGTSTGTLRTNITSIGTSTATLRTDITTLWTATGTLKAQIAAVALSTGTFSTIGTDTATLRTDLLAVAQSTSAFTAVGASTATLRADLLSVKQSTAVTITSNWITLGATQTYVTTLSTRIASGIQTQPFTISSATARVNGGTSATLRLFITDKNTEFNISAATPIWNTGVVAGTAHTGGTLSNTAVAADQCITAVIDGISGAVVDIVLWVRGNR